MSRILYVEPEEEITDLVDRLRRTGDEPDLVLVFPNRARVLQSQLNLRLLQQYSRSFVKNTAIVSGDPRAQGLARGAGFPTYASLQAFDRGVEVLEQRPVVTSDGGMPAIGSIVDGAPPAELEPAVEPPFAPGPPSPPAVAAARPPGRRLGRFYAGAAALFLVGLILLFLVAPTAKVTIHLVATPISAQVTLQGTTDAQAAQQPDHVRTTVVSSDAQGQLPLNPTGTKQVPATGATGAIVFVNRAPFAITFTIPQGEEFDSSNPPLKFYATQTVAVVAPAAGTSNAVPVEDGTGEAKGNVGPNTITSWPEDPCRGSQPPSQCGQLGAGDFTVTNPQPTTGGQDAKTQSVLSPQDVQQAQQQIDQLKQQLIDGVTAAMQRQASGQTLAKDPKGGGVAVGAEVKPALGKAGDDAAPTTLTVTARGTATAYNPDDVRKALVADLQKKVGDGEQLAENPDLSKVQLIVATSDGRADFSGTVSGYSQRSIDRNALRSQLAGQTQATARQIVQARYGDKVEGVDIQQFIPFFVLPLFSSRIELVVLVDESASQPPPAPSPSASAGG